MVRYRGDKSACCNSKDSSELDSNKNTYSISTRTSFLFYLIITGKNVNGPDLSLNQGFLSLNLDCERTDQRKTEYLVIIKVTYLRFPEISEALTGLEDTGGRGWIDRYVCNEKGYGRILP